MNARTVAHTAVNSSSRRPLIVSVLGWVTAAFNTRRSRRQLLDLDADRLNDLGISQTAAETEAKRPIWDVPSHWIN